MLAREIVVQCQGNIRQAPLRIVGLCRVGGAEQLIDSGSPYLQRLASHHTLDAVEDEYPVQSRSVCEHAHCHEHRDGQADDYRPRSRP